jgi:uncharacterized secreted repeat protein (TIGR03808 family)
MFSRRQMIMATLAFTAAAISPGRAWTQWGGALDGGALALKPNSPDDQTPALEKALAAAAEQKKPLYLPAGTYRASKVKLPDSVRLVGAGNETRLVLAAPGPLLVAEGGKSIGLAQLVLDGENRVLPGGTALLTAQNVEELDLLSCRVTSSGGHGVALEACGGRVHECVLDNARFAALFARNSLKLSIVDNSVRDCANNGILVWRTASGDDGSLIRGNRIDDIRADSGGSGQNGNAINVFRAGGVIVSDNVIRRCAFSGVRANSTENVQITGNSIRNMGEVGIFVEFGFSGAVVSNNMIDRAASGISLTNFNEGGRLGVVSGNLIRDLFRRPDPESGVETYGAGIAAEADAMLSGNVVEGAAFAGLQLGYGPYLRDVNAVGNLIRESNVGIVVSVVAGAGSATIRSNTVARAAAGAVVGYAWDKPASGDLAVEGTGAFPNVHLSDTTII